MAQAKETSAVNRAADRHVKAFSRTMRRAFDAAVRSIALGEAVMHAKRANRGGLENQVALAMRAQEEVLRLQLPDLFADVWVSGAKAAQRELDKGVRALKKGDPPPTIPNPKDVKPEFDFARSNWQAKIYAQSQSANLITNITAETKSAVRTIMSEAFRDKGIPPAQTARMIREVVGLTPQQAASVLKLRNRLVENPGKLVYAGKTPIRVPANGISADRLDRALEAYGSRLRNSRALTIARTETIATANEGQRQLWLYRQKQGDLTGRERRKWITSFGACPICAGLNGTLTTITEPFAPGVMGPPAHPRCRCTQSLVLIPKKDVPFIPPTPPIASPVAPPQSFVPPQLVPKPPVAAAPTPVAVPQAPPILAPTKPATPRTTLPGVTGKESRKKAKLIQAAVDREFQRLADQFPKVNQLLLNRKLRSVQIMEKIPGHDTANGVYYSHYKRIALKVDAHPHVDVNMSYRTGQWSISKSTRDIVETFRHELGHHVHMTAMSKRAQAEWVSVYDEMLKRSKSRWSSESIHQSISEYAATNKEELFAESFTMYGHRQYGKGNSARLPKLVEDFMKKWVGEARTLTGLRVKSLRITELTISVMRQRVAHGEALSTMAADYGVSVDYVQDVVERRIWKDVA